MVSLSTTLSVLTLTASVLGAGLTGKPSKPDSKIARNVLEGKSQGYCSPSGPIESTHCLYETVESLNTALFPKLQKLVHYPFFRHYKVDLYRECPFWYENAFCMNRDCGVEAADESEIPEKWRARALSEVRHSSTTDGVSGCYFREQDFCYIEDDATQDGQYIDLTLNPERFTGYAGASAHQVWRAIYEENCFGLSEAAMDAAQSGSQHVISALAGLSASGNDAGVGFSKLSEGWGTEMVKGALKNDDMCEEKKVYYRVISGLHASISIHICHEYLDQTTGEWSPNLQCFINRLATHPERLSNVYFNAVLLLRAVARAGPYLEKYDIGTAPSLRYTDERSVARRAEDHQARQTLKEVLGLADGEMGKGFDESDFFAGQDAKLLKEQFKSHFRNVSRIMDCVGCDKCRLWGKLQVSGLGTALKILFELDDKALDPRRNPDLLQRSEVVALFNTLHRVSESLAAVEDFRKMYAVTQAEEARTSRNRKPRRPLPPPKKNLRDYLSPSAVLGLVVSALEALRRSCRGCLELCWRKIVRGFGSDILQWFSDLFGQASAKVDL
ncbi:endoplasmic reticulum Oxidoreductin 1-domain-containing protein [Kockovaella imperatae]|uniref:Endoplasmic reticulum Oxidoreductin 1-domain-containing protein n=1 Tax=Kockovaella imperatae TaxID=4999 RepID=A0A1Y1UJJ3_9TREE|nr:endoplasmic reticulum Oxidoreductin 1-domain-containing protein [Kockovaella imperatae]ORX37674.1 endoplasmic reticulum Oxidoreductin 1-domain-containing protein [Kockovaella imperatae]